MARFDGIPVGEQQRKPRFSGELVSAPADFSDVTASVDTTAEQPDRPYRGSLFNQLIELASGPAPLQGSTTEERKADYQSRPAALRGVVGAGQAVDSLIRGVAQLTDTTTPEMEARSRELGQVVAGDLPTTGGRAAADLAMLFAPGGAAAKLPTLATRMGGQAAIGAGFGALQAEDAPGQRLWNALIGGALGGAGEAVGSGLRAAGARVAPQAKAVYERAKDFGIDVLPSQLTDVPFISRLQGMMRNLPGNGAAEAFDTQRAQFTSAVGRLIGAEGDRLTPDVFSAARQRIGNEFERLTAQNQLKLEDALLGRLGDIQREAADLGEEGTARAVSSIVDRVLGQSKDGALPGRAYQSIDTQLGKLARAGGEKGYFLSEVREALRDAMDSSISPQTSQAWQAARRQWRDMKAIEPLVAKAEDGIISPAQLMGRVTADRAGRASMAQGTRGELGDLARVGQALKAPQSSGTAENMLAGGALNPVNWPGLLAGVFAGRTVGRALNNPRLADFIVSNEARPAVANALATVPSPLSLALASALRGAPVTVEPDPRRANNGR